MQGNAMLKVVAGVGLIALFMVSFTVSSSGESGAANERPYHVLRHGKIGRSEWLAWVDGGSRRKVGSARVCLGLALSVQGSLSESHECNIVSASEPVVESISAMTTHGERSVFVVLLTPKTHSVFVRVVGQSIHRTVTVRHVSKEAGDLVGVVPIAFWVRGFAKKACLRRVIAYDDSGLVLSDSGRLKC
jgi:hypothetical protein